MFSKSDNKTAGRYRFGTDIVIKMDSLGSNEDQDGLENGLKVSESHSLEESYSISDVESLLSAPNTDEHSVESLRFENTRLRLACTQLLNENYIAGQHGLDLLEEKENIRKSFDSLQKENDQLKNELTITQQVRLMTGQVIGALNYF